MAREFIKIIFKNDEGVDYNNWVTYKDAWRGHTTNKYMYIYIEADIINLVCTNIQTNTIIRGDFSQHKS